ncbi:MAG: DNA helicase PcrA [Gemmatimonadales bacterium]|nr:MAG: DNA helicase PcrA [Gemmatimonadales bacterium]
MTIDIQLNPAQREAVEHPRGPVLVLAGAGSGKTRVLTARLAHLIRAHRIAPNKIMAVTFTNRAAEEMRRRVAELLGGEPAGLWIGTFHSLFARLLRREGHLLGFTPDFTIYDEDDRLEVVKRLLERHGYNPKSYPPRLIASLISSAKNRLLSPSDLESRQDDPMAKVAGEIYRALNQALASANAMDFDDLLLHPLTLFQRHPERLAHYQRRFASILVDEFQDTNRAQYLLVRQLAAAQRDIFVVGDDDQSIYSWRGAEVRNMLEFQQDFPDATLVRLEQNYRSTPRILAVANEVISGNRARLGKTLFTTRPGGEKVAVVAAADERDEAEWVARELRERSASDGYAFSEMAVLYRTNAQSRAFEEAFRRAGIPHRVVGTVSFYQRREVRDVIAYLRLIVNPADDEAFLRAIQVPRRGIGLASLGALQAAAQKWKRPLLEAAAIADRIGDLRPLAKEAFMKFAAMIERFRQKARTAAPAVLIEELLGELDYESYLAEEGPDGIERIENIRELVAGAAEWAEAEHDPEDPASLLQRFLTTAALATSEENVGGDPEGVTLLTVHSAKGLEWPIVVVAGLEDGLFPLSRAMETEEGAEEERRLCYVAITRARDRLYLTWARSRRRGGQLLPGRPSRFLEALPPQEIEERRTGGIFGGEWTRRPLAAAWVVSGESLPEEHSQDAPRYVKGERVRHRHFGSGTILGLSGYGRQLKVVVEFDDESVGVKQLLVAHAGLQRDWDGA